MSRRGAILELAVLGLLHEQPLHGYELGKRLNGVLGAFRVVSYGSLYPCLANLSTKGFISQERDDVGRKTRITYALTTDGAQHFLTLMSQAAPSGSADEHFDVQFAFFSRISQDVRLRILEGRRTKLEQRLDESRAAARARRARFDAYTAELHRHGLESTEREVRWLNELIHSERGQHSGSHPSSPDGISAMPGNS